MHSDQRVCDSKKVTRIKSDGTTRFSGTEKKQIRETLHRDIGSTRTEVADVESGAAGACGAREGDARGAPRVPQVPQKALN